MSWLQVKKKHKQTLINFILKDEWAHVSFSEKLKEGQRGYTVVADYINTSPDTSKRTPLLNFRKFRPPGKTSIESAILFSQYGIMFPIFGEESLKNMEQLDTYINGFRRNIYSIMGIKNDVTAAEKLLKLTPHTEVNYYLMILTAEDFFKKYDYHGAKDRAPDTYGTRRISIKRATIRDAKELFPLERDYQLEEVIINPGNYNPKFIMEMFKKNLSKNIVLFAEIDGIPVSKAGTNAQGFYTDQIGGVYTAKQERGKGFARDVMIRLLGCIFKDKKTASLFVKKENIPAVKLYEHLGFTIMNDFKISYF